MYGPLLTWGVYGRYFVLGIGDGEAEALVKRMDASPPAWRDPKRAAATHEKIIALIRRCGKGDITDIGKIGKGK
ncbi:MAG: hypothetical protein ACUVUC_08510 [Thermoguttaceae bacterium]